MFTRAIVVSCALVAASAGALTGCASPGDASQAVEGAAQQAASTAQQAASTAENASSNVASGVADWYHHRDFGARERAEFRRDVRRDEHRDIRREAARVAERRVEHARWGWFERARRWWR